MSTPNMGLILPVVSTTIGPLYASENNQAFSVVDAHDHSPSNGVPIPTSGININADLAFNSFNATLLRSTRYVNQVSPLSGPFDITCVYFSGGNFYVNNGIGQAIQITAGAALNASSIGGIGGDYSTSTASVFYTSADSTFTFWSAPNTSASIDGGPLTIRNNTANSFGVTISANGSLSTNFGLTLFPTLPSSTKILTVDNVGNIGDAYDVDNATLTITSNTIMVNAAGIQLSNMAANSVGTSQLVVQSVTQEKLAPRSTGSTVGTGGVAISSSFTGNFASTSYIDIPGLTVTITTTGRPVLLQLIGLAGDNQGFVGVGTVTATTISGNIAFLNGSTIVTSLQIQHQITTNTIIAWAASAFQCLDMPAAGTYTYKIQAKTSQSAPNFMTMNNVQLMAYEI